MAKFAIIGGTGFSQHAADFEPVHTDYGDVNVGKIKIGNDEVYYIFRHDKIRAPNEVNFRANIEALRILGVDTIFGISACGRISSDVVPGHMLLVSNIYRTWGLGERETSFGEEGLIVHTGPPFFDRELSDLIEEAYHEINPKYDPETGLRPGFHNKGIYTVVNGPTFDDHVEEKVLNLTMCLAGYFRHKVIGMTLFPEAALAHELGMRYYGLAMCTDYSSTPPKNAKPVTHGGVKDASKIMGTAAYEVIKKAIEKVPDEYAPSLGFPVLRADFSYDALKKSRPVLAGMINSYMGPA